MGVNQVGMENVRNVLDYGEMPTSSNRVNNLHFAVIDITQTNVDYILGSQSAREQSNN